MNGWGGIMTSLLQLYITVLRAHCKFFIVFVLSKRPGRLINRAGMINPIFIDVSAENQKREEVFIQGHTAGK